MVPCLRPPGCKAVDLPHTTAISGATATRAIGDRAFGEARSGQRTAGTFRRTVWRLRERAPGPQVELTRAPHPSDHATRGQTHRGDVPPGCRRPLRPCSWATPRRNDRRAPQQSRYRVTRTRCTARRSISRCPQIESLVSRAVTRSCASLEIGMSPPVHPRFESRALRYRCRTAAGGRAGPGRPRAARPGAGGAGVLGGQFLARAPADERPVRRCCRPSRCRSRRARRGR